MPRQRPQFSGFADRVVLVNIYRQFIRPSRRNMALPGYDRATRRVPLTRTLTASGRIIQDNYDLILGGDTPADIEVAILPQETTYDHPNLQDGGFNVHYEFQAFPRFRWNGITETDVVRYRNPANPEEWTEMYIDRMINDPMGFQAFLLNTQARPA